MEFPPDDEDSSSNRKPSLPPIVKEALIQRLASSLFLKRSGDINPKLWFGDGKDDDYMVQIKKNRPTGPGVPILLSNVLLDKNSMAKEAGLPMPPPAK